MVNLKSSSPVPKRHGVNPKSKIQNPKLFDGVVFTSIDERYDYEEIREISIGSIQGVVIITVAHTDRNGKIRLISARKATPKERRTYYEYLAQST
ncbi:BrnT family toxin [Nostoc sp. UHCC 0926]|uniref:BrnT family toxin n=1 Tax=unclassified Nostoc TaxID=2593658 RepID=UPI00235F5343|nr:BrnT family toxin [Nostoc sp. UHCC 0926]WDD35725.1 BrnT family toxin [Nostoc sp. UHCC 0926]